MSRSGIGYDAHPLVLNRPLVLGGIEIPNDKGLDGHSDGDVAIHAIIDALLGAAALGDIGTHFNAADPKYPEGISSLTLLAKTVQMLREHGWQVENLDVTIVAESPKLSPYIQPMRDAVSSTKRIDLERINYKATTTDGMGYTGSGIGIIGIAVASIDRSNV